MILYFKCDTTIRHCISNRYTSLCNGEIHLYVMMRIYSKDDRHTKQDEFFCNAFTSCEKHNVTQDENIDILEITPNYFYRLFKKEMKNKTIKNTRNITEEYLQLFL